MIHQASHVKSPISDAITGSAFQVAGVVITIMTVVTTQMSLNVQTRIIGIAQNPSFLAQMECVFTFPNFVMIGGAEWHCAVRQVSSMYESTMGISYMKKMQFFTWNLNLWSKRLNGLSHRVYQIKKSKIWQIYDVFGIFQIFLENIVHNKSGNHNGCCLLLRGAVTATSHTLVRHHTPQRSERFVTRITKWNYICSDLKRLWGF